MRTLAPPRARTDVADSSVRPGRSPEAPTHAPFAPDARTLTAPSLLSLQRGAGNAAVAGFLGSPAPVQGGCGSGCGCAACAQSAGEHEHDHEHETTAAVPSAGGACSSSATAPRAAPSRQIPDGVAVRDTAAPGPAPRAGCGVAAIGAPAGCTALPGDAVGETVLFQRNCDDFLSPDEQAKVEAFADSMIETDRVKVHGFASVDGQLEYNDNLSCARAVRVVGILLARGIAPGQIELFKHGETAGDPVTRRSVVLERDPPVSRPAVPQLTPVVVTAPTPGNCGGMNFVIQWQMSRNAGALGGFVIQDIEFLWAVIDCDGNPVPNPDPRTSPLHYFEAWRAAPNTTNLTPVNTDTFFWPDSLPWAGGCTDGVVFITAVARFHDEVAALPGHMVANNPATFAGGLQSSLTDPALGGNISRPVDHRLVFHWNCCPCSTSPTVVDDHAP